MTNCEAFRNRLQDFLEGKLTADERAVADDHLRLCAGCRSLVSFDLVPAILAETTGSACERAGKIVCAYVDDELQPLDRKLLELHNGSCGECASMTRALARLSTELPAMAELSPPASLLDGVLAATSHKPRPLAGLWAGLSRGWAALLARPRLAWETGYVGAMAVWLIVGLFGADLKAAAVPLPPSVRPSEIVGNATAGVESLGKQAWATTGGPGLEALRTLQSNIDERIGRTEPARERLRHNGDRFKQAALDLDLKESKLALGELSRGAQNMLRDFMLADPNETTEGD